MVAGDKPQGERQISITELRQSVVAASCCAQATESVELQGVQILKRGIERRGSCVVDTPCQECPTP